MSQIPRIGAQDRGPGADSWASRLDAVRYIRVTTMRVDRERNRPTTRVVAAVTRVTGAVRRRVLGKK